MFNILLLYVLFEHPGHTYGGFVSALSEWGMTSFLRRCSKILLPIFWWPAAIRINVVYWFGVDLLIFNVARSWASLRFDTFLYCSSLQKCWILDLLNFANCS
jgi:hypothetical protein